MTRFFLAVLCAFALTFSGTASATIIQSGDLNFISDAGNSSDGLGFLDMTFSVGLTSAAALTNAQLTYADARLATPTELNNLYLGAGVTLTPGGEPSTAFNLGSDYQVTASSPGVSEIYAALGDTTGGFGQTLIWSIPDGSASPATTRDVLQLLSTGDSWALQSPGTPVDPGIGWLLVSDAAVVPEPSTGLLVALGVLGLGVSRRRDAVRMSTHQ